jgi:glucose/arabinose dehydrogenase
MELALPKYCAVETPIRPCTLSGYKVVFVPFVGKDGKAFGRPVGVAVDRAGALRVAEDVGNAVWRVTPAR